MDEQLLPYRNQSLSSQPTLPSRRTARPRRSRFLGFLGALLLSLPALKGLAIADNKEDPVVRLDRKIRHEGLLPRAFLEGHRARLFFEDQGNRLLLKGSWKPARPRAQEFQTYQVELKPDLSPPPLPRPHGSWRALKVLPFDEWRPFLRSALERLTPSEARHGVYLQHALGEAVLYRDPHGQVRPFPLTNTPPGTILDRRFSPTQTANALAAAMEASLRSSYPEEPSLLLAPPPAARRLRYAIVDLTERRVIVLLAPRPGEKAGGRAPLGSKLTGLASFVLLDHVWAFVKNPVSSLGRVANQAWEWSGAFFDPRLRSARSACPPVTNAPGMDLADWERWLDRHTGTPREMGSVKLLIAGEQFFPAFERRLAEAQHRIDLHVCIFDRDDVGVRLADQLKARSSNVTVRVAFDRLNTRAAGRAPPGTPLPDGFIAPRSIGAYLRAGSKVQVRPLPNPALSADHSKIFIVDGRYAYLGGMNLGREYRYEWHDLMVEVEGPVVASLQRQFNKLWAQHGPWGDCGLAAESLCGQPQPPPETGPETVELRRLYTKNCDRQIRRAALAAIGRARNRVYLENPYLFDNAVIAALTAARRRGVDVRVVFPSENDLAPGHRANLTTANHLLDHGVRVYLYPGMTHVKAMLADGWVCFGSANFDALSLRLNREANLASSDPSLAARFQRDLFETDFAASRELLQPIAVGWGDHLADSILNFF